MATNTLTLLSVFAASLFCAALGDLAEQNEILNKHNAFRRGVDPVASNMLEMSWNDEAAANAQKWADTCSMGHSGSNVRYINTSGCGENIFMSTDKQPWSAVVKDWYDEVKNWRYGVGSVNGGEVGHFTQVVWYRSHEVGCAMAYCPNSYYKYFYVCQYCPPGNLQFARPYKSGSSCGDCPDACVDNLCTNPCPYSDLYSNCAQLKTDLTCQHTAVHQGCPASCLCATEVY